MFSTFAVKCKSKQQNKISLIKLFYYLTLMSIWILPVFKSTEPMLNIVLCAVITVAPLGHCGDISSPTCPDFTSFNVVLI